MPSGVLVTPLAQSHAVHRGRGRPRGVGNQRLEETKGRQGGRKGSSVSQQHRRQGRPQARVQSRLSNTRKLPVSEAARLSGVYRRLDPVRHREELDRRRPGVRSTSPRRVQAQTRLSSCPRVGSLLQVIDRVETVRPGDPGSLRSTLRSPCRRPKKSRSLSNNVV